MKNVPLVVCFSILMAACTSTSINPHPLRQIMADYRSIEEGMTEAQVVALLGAPDRIDKNGVLHWWQDIDPYPNSDRFAELDVTFDSEWRVLETKVRSGNDHYSDAGGGVNAPLDPRSGGSYSVFRP